MAVTIKDLASRCGLSVSTVSKAFNNYEDISKETRELVRRVAKEMGYYPNAIARTLKTNRSYNLGVLFDDGMNSGLTHAFFMNVLNSFKVEAEKRGYDITFINHHVANSRMTYLEHCRYRNIDGVFLACANFEEQEVIDVATSSLPAVALDHPYPSRSAVLSDNPSGMKQLVEYAAGLGHTRIAYIHGAMSFVTEQRVGAFRATMRMLGLDDTLLCTARYDDPDSVREAVKQLMTPENPPTCILLPDDHGYLGALAACSELGLKTPEDVSFAGFDGSMIAKLSSPKLTTIAQDTAALGSEAARLLVERIENSSAPAEVVHVQTSLLEGESVARRG